MGIKIHYFDRTSGRDVDAIIIRQQEAVEYYTIKVESRIITGVHKSLIKELN